MPGSGGSLEENSLFCSLETCQTEPKSLAPEGQLKAQLPRVMAKSWILQDAGSQLWLPIKFTWGFQNTDVLVSPETEIGPDILYFVFGVFKSYSGDTSTNLKGWEGLGWVFSQTAPVYLSCSTPSLLSACHWELSTSE